MSIKLECAGSIWFISTVVEQVGVYGPFLSFFYSVRLWVQIHTYYIRGIGVLCQRQYELPPSRICRRGVAFLDEQRLLIRCFLPGRAILLQYFVDVILKVLRSSSRCRVVIIFFT